MRVDIRAIGFATAATVALVSALCRLAFVVAPDAATSVASYLVHSDYTALIRTPTVGSFVGGVAGWAVVAGAATMAVAWLYNRLVARAPLPA